MDLTEGPHVLNKGMKIDDIFFRVRYEQRGPKKVEFEEW